MPIAAPPIFSLLLCVGHCFVAPLRFQSSLFDPSFCMYGSSLRRLASRTAAKLVCMHILPKAFKAKRKKATSEKRNSTAFFFLPYKAVSLLLSSSLIEFLFLVGFRPPSSKKISERKSGVVERDYYYWQCSSKSRRDVLPLHLLFLGLFYPAGSRRGGEKGVKFSSAAGVTRKLFLCSTLREAQENVAWVPKMVNLLLGFERSRASGSGLGGCYSYFSLRPLRPPTPYPKNDCRKRMGDL